MNDNNNEGGKKFGMDLKIIIVGDLSTGKTSIINRYIKGNFDQLNKATIAPEFSYKIINRKDVIYRIQFWDIPGQNRSSELTSVFCRDTQGIIFCADSNRIESRNSVSKWEDCINEFNDIKDVPKIIIENKCDLLGDESHYNDNFNSLKEFSDNHGYLGYFRTSALTGYNINEAIDFLIEEIIKSMNEEDIQYYNSKIIKIDNSINSNNEKNRCC